MAIPTAMMVPTKDCTFKVVPVIRSASTTPVNTAGAVPMMAKARRKDWK